MTTSLIELLAKKEGIESLPKIDPNTQKTPMHDGEPINLLSQAAITSVLAAFYKYSRDEVAAESILQKEDILAWPDKLFGENKSNLIVKIAAYADVSAAQAKTKINKIIADFLQVVKEQVAEPSGKSVKNLLSAQRNTILSHLPAVIGIGKMLDDTTLDDRTNKMEGPVSGLMHTIEKTFAASGPETEKKENF